jgi:hypothetical protein
MRSFFKRELADGLNQTENEGKESLFKRGMSEGSAMALKGYLNDSAKLNHKIKKGKNKKILKGLCIYLPPIFSATRFYP